MLLDLAQAFYDVMPGVRFESESGDMVELTAHIGPYMTHVKSSPPLRRQGFVRDI